MILVNVDNDTAEWLHGWADENCFSPAQMEANQSLEVKTQNIADDTRVVTSSATVASATTTTDSPPITTGYFAQPPVMSTATVAATDTVSSTVTPVVSATPAVEPNVEQVQRTVITATTQTATTVTTSYATSNISGATVADSSQLQKVLSQSRSISSTSTLDQSTDEARYLLEMLHEIF